MSLLKSVGSPSLKKCQMFPGVICFCFSYRFQAEAKCHFCCKDGLKEENSQFCMRRNDGKYCCFFIVHNG